MKQLFEYGEKNIVNELIYKKFPHLHSFHGDAVNISASQYNSFSFSTDPCPEPIVSFFDKKNRYYHYGFLSVVINYSDLAACGSEPIGILLSTVMPNEMTDEDYMKFLEGVNDACNLWGGKLLGGNIKDGKNFTVTGTSIGGHRDGTVFTRTGIQNGDAICTIGDLGVFWIGIIQLLEGKKVDDLDQYTKSFLVSPRPKITESRILADSGLVSSCMDNSDGIIGCLYELSELNNITIRLESDLLFPSKKMEDFCKVREIDYRNLMLSFGGWDLLFACNPEYITALKILFKEQGCDFNVIGYATPYEGENVVFQNEKGKYKIKDFSSKRFDKHSYFSFGLDAFMKQFRNNNFQKIV